MIREKLEALVKLWERRSAIARRAAETYVEAPATWAGAIGHADEARACAAELRAVLVDLRDEHRRGWLEGIEAAAIRLESANVAGPLHAEVMKASVQAIRQLARRIDFNATGGHMPGCPNLSGGVCDCGGPVEPP